MSLYTRRGVVMRKAVRNVRSLKRLCGMVAIIGLCLLIGQAGGSDFHLSTSGEDIRVGLAGLSMLILAVVYNNKLDDILGHIHRVNKHR